MWITRKVGLPAGMALVAAQALAAPSTPDGHVQLHLSGFTPADAPVYTITYSALAALSGLPPVVQAKPSFLHLDIASLISGVGPRLLFLGIPGSGPGQSAASSPAPSSPLQAAIASLLPGGPATPSGTAAVPSPGSASGPSPAPGPGAGTGTGTGANINTGTGTNIGTDTSTNTSTSLVSMPATSLPAVLDGPTPVVVDGPATPVPEPASLALAAGTLALALATRRRRRA